MSAAIGLWAFGVLGVFALLSTAAIFRPGDRGQPRAVKPFWTDWVAISIVVAFACIPATILGQATRIIVDHLAETPEWSERWGKIFFTVVFIASHVFWARFFWNKAFSTIDVNVGQGAALTPFRRRVFGVYLAEGAHKLIFFIKASDPISLQLRIGDVQTFQELSSDKVLMTIRAYVEYQVFNPAGAFDITNPDTAFNRRFEAGAREYVRNHTDDDLTLPPQPTIKTAKAEMSGAIEAELVAFSKDFVIGKSIKVEVLEIRPPQAEIDAAVDARAAIFNNKAKMTRILGLKERIGVLQEGREDLSSEQAGVMVQAEEDTITRSAFVFENLEKASAAAGKSFAEALKAGVERVTNATVNQSAKGDS